MLNIVVSGVNMVEGGILSILKDVLSSLSRLQMDHEISVTALVHKKELVAGHYDANIKILEYPDIKTGWLKRLRFEYITSKKLSEEMRTDLWIALHDMTPNVACPMQVVYCHNPSPFYEVPVRKFFYDTTFSLFTLFYKHLYGINIKKNDHVIIQQDWIRKAFKKMYGVNSIVAYPKFFDTPPEDNETVLPLTLEPGRTTFFYPSFPRIFKNMECACKAAEILSKTNTDFDLIITLDGTENKYAAKIYNDYKHVSQIKFIGLQPRQVIEKLYSYTDCLLFPSKLETWGLPISEFMPYQKPILIADMPYAHETIGAFKMAKFFKADDSKELSKQMQQVIIGKFIPDSNNPKRPTDPFFDSWDNLLSFLIESAMKKARVNKIKA